ncbi:receptor-type tyrosine-protein phosphatase mu [Elysia marginata]|uniref:Receptor-type tyrosine-protein phosphatase mu n=1 Tax=Elysia marginata TaxID=1093978 RepID=A0AAV4GV41_9GAST|nr:receptor-type tyrosine-protein phosphatase mu [Elysia marginata]
MCNLLQEAEATGKMDFRATLWKLRQDRMHTVQTVEQYVYLHHAALVGHMVAGTTVKLKDLSYRFFSLESVKEGNKSTRNYKQEFEALVEVCDATTCKVSEPPEEERESCTYQNMKDLITLGKDRLGNILPNPSYRPDLIADNIHNNTYINAVFVPNLIRDRQDILTQLPLPNTVTDFWRLVSQYNVRLLVAFDTESENTDETIGEFLPKSVTEPFENDSFIIESKSAEENGLVTEISLTVQQKNVPGLDSSSNQTKKALTLLLCKSSQMDPPCVLELQEKIQARRPMNTSRTIYMCRNGADKSGLMCIQSILLDIMKLDRCLTVPLMVGKVKAIRPQVIPTVDQYKCLYRVLKLAYESQNVYNNVGERQGSSSMT